MKKCIFVLAAVSAVACASGAELGKIVAAKHTRSPDGRLVAHEEIDGDGSVSVRLKYDSRDIVAIGNVVQGAVKLGESVESCNVSWINEFGERRLVRDKYNAETWDLEIAGRPAKLEMRLYDAGFAWRVTYGGEGEIEFAGDATTFRFWKDWTCWPVTHAQGHYEPFKLSDFTAARARPGWAPVAAGIGEMHNYATDIPETMEAPFVVEGEGFVAAIGDAAVTDFAKVRIGKGAVTNSVRFVLEGDAKAKAPCALPWRYVRVAKDASSLYAGNDLLLNLNPPSKISDTSWIKPGKVLRVAKLDTETGKAAVDFVVSNNMQFIEIDCGWYGQEHLGDPTKPGLAPERVAKGEKFDLHEIIAYAKTKCVPVILYVNREPLKKNIDGILDELASWGVAGVKYGFVHVGAQEWTKWLSDAIAKAVERRLMVDIHDEYRLSGNQRTWPNVMTVEGIHGNEEMPDAAHDAALVFTRYIAGPGDYTPCWKVGRVKNTLAHQLAMGVATFSPWQFLFWYSRPDQIDAANPALDVWREMPTVWDDSVALGGEIGKYAVVARRKGGKWFVAGVNGMDRRTFTLPLDFCGKGPFVARIFTDADASITNGLGKVAVGRRFVYGTDTLEIEAAARGGFTVILEPFDELRLKEKLPMVFDRAQAQAKFLIGEMSRLGIANELPRSWTRGKYKTEDPKGWTTGFFPGSLWFIYARTGKPEWKAAAEEWTEKLYPAKDYTGNHDMGFMFLCSYGNGIKYGGHGDDYASVVKDATRALASRYSPEMGMIRSWDEPRFMQFPVIIDSMMNLEMMEWSAKRFGIPEYDRMARSHADKLNANHFRSNETAWHVTDWNPKTGKIWARYAWQGACVDGAWARGQGWSVYGYTMFFRETGDEKYLKRAIKSADWILSAPNLPEDKIPYWDYYAAGIPDAPRDASAAAVMASALLELSGYVPPKDAARYRSAAVQMLLSLSSPEYLADEGDCGGFLLKHSTGHLPENTEIDASINYADYYFLEALTRL